MEKAYKTYVTLVLTLLTKGFNVVVCRNGSAYFLQQGLCLQYLIKKYSANVSYCQNIDI